MRNVMWAALLASMATLGAHADQAPNPVARYPDRPIQIVVPFPAGGTVDILARTVGTHLSTKLGQQVMVVNKPGASGNIGVELVAKAAPDGYTLVLGSSSTHVVNRYLYSKLPFDPVKDFAPISLLATVANILVVNAQLPVSSVKDLIDLAKRRPDTLSYASFGNGTSPHLAGALFARQAGLRITHVPYKGGPPAMTDLLGNQVQMMFSNVPIAVPHITTGKLKALAVTSDRRLPELPNVTTMKEAGLPDFVVTQAFGLYAPAGTSPAVVTLLTGAVQEALRDSGVRKTLDGNGFNIVGSSAAELAAANEAESVKWEKVIKESGAHID